MAPGQPTPQPIPATPQAPLPTGLVPAPESKIVPILPSPIEQMFEQSYEVSIPQTISRQIKQFGYDLFRAPSSTFAPVTDVPVGPDFVLGPGDSMNIFIWGLVENVLTVTIDRNGNIFLPRVGPLRLAGLPFSEAENQMKSALSRYFKKFDLKVVMRDLHTITVFVVGEVARPGGYTISSLSTISNALYMAGGPSKNGTMRAIRLLRNNKSICTLDLYEFLLFGDKKNDQRLETGDTIFVPPIGPVAGISGMVKRPAIYELKGPMHISQLIDIAAGLIPVSYLRRVQIERVKSYHEKVVMDLDISSLYEGISPEANVEIKDGDFVKVFPIDTLILNLVSLRGAVKYPGDYELKPNMTVGQLLTPEKLLPQSYLDKVEIVRTKPDFTYEVRYFDLRKFLQGDTSEDMPLQDLDRIVVNTEKRPSESITITGEVKRPGTYALAKGERLSSLLRRVGGFTSEAYLKSVIFTRKAIRDAEKEQLDKFVKTQQQQFLSEAAAYQAAGLSMEEAAEQRSIISQRQQFLQLLSQQIPLGRISIQIDTPEKLEGTARDILLSDEDALQIPKTPSAVLVIGSVYNQSAFSHKEGENYRYYLEQAGGLSPDAAEKEIYILKADGSGVRSFLKMRKIEVGDTIIVPVSTEAKYRPIPLARDFATIIGQFAVTLGVIIALF